MFRAILAAVWLTLLAQPATASPLYEETPAEFANHFYHTYGALRVHGIPNQKQLHALSPFLSPELVGLFTEAENLQTAIQAKDHPDSKRPPMKAPGSASDLFTSNSEGCAATYAIAFPRSALGKLILPMHLADPDTGAAWVDELMLHHHGNEWVIADIVFSRDRHNRLNGKGTLRHVLRDWIRWTRRHE